jgi:agmatine deiminase
MKKPPLLFTLVFSLMLLNFVLLKAQHQRRFVAEWEPSWGTLIRWPLGIPSALVVELASDDSLYVLVANQNQKQQATNTFTSWNVNLDHVQFITALTNSHWTRDWGPHYVFDEQGIAGIADPYFNGYPWVPGCFMSSAFSKPNELSVKDEIRYVNDNLVNGVLANTFNCPLISLPMFMTGGNVMVDGRQTAVATQQMLDENFPGITEEQFMQYAADSLGITNFIIVSNPEVHGIQHIDCYAKFLDEETILVKQVPNWHPEYYCCEALAGELANENNAYGEPYNIIRIYCEAYYGNNAAAYTNSYILNNKVLVPLFGISHDQQALQVYQDAMPGYEVIGFQWSGWYHYDALHCRVMGIFDRYMLRIEHKPLGGNQEFTGVPVVKARVDDRSENGLVPDSLRLFWRETGQSAWNVQVLGYQPGTDSLFAIIPGSSPGKTYEYYIAASDYSGRSETHPRTAPAGFHSFTFSGSHSDIFINESANKLLIEPGIFTNETSICVQTKQAGGSIFIWSTSGMRVKEIKIPANGSNSVVWDGTDRHGISLPAGVYIVQYVNNGTSIVEKCILAR